MTESPKLEDLDPVETREWLESIDSVLQDARPGARALPARAAHRHTRRSRRLPAVQPNTAYLNTIAVGREPAYPGNRELERRIEAYIRWNALAMVLRANRMSTEYGGHLASYASSATLYEVGFNHFWRGAVRQSPGRYGVHPGAFVAGHLCAFLPRGAPVARSSCATSARKSTGAAWAVLLSAPVADAGLLAVSRPCRWAWVR